MTATVELPEKIEEAVEQKVADGEYSSKSDFIREAIRTHLDKVLLTPEKIAERARELGEGDAETFEWENFREEL